MVLKATWAQMAGPSRPVLHHQDGEEHAHQRQGGKLEQLEVGDAEDQARDDHRGAVGEVALQRPEQQAPVEQLLHDRGADRDHDRERR